METGESKYVTATAPCWARYVADAFSQAARPAPVVSPTAIWLPNSVMANGLPVAFDSASTPANWVAGAMY